MGSLGWKNFSSTTPHFFKIIVEETSRDHRLKIPKNFMVRYGEDLSNSVCLKLPSGSEWVVELTRCNGKAWLEKGWPEFSRFCSLDYGTFLIFQYEGNSRFGVCIFDKSATEIDYPLTMPKIEEVDEDDLSIEISEDLPHCPKRRENSSLLCPPCKKMRTCSSGKLDIISGNGDIQTYGMVVFEKPMTNKDSHCSKGKIKVKKPNISEQVIQRPSSSLRASRSNLEAANKFVPENPFFLVTLRAYERVKLNPYVPAKFVRSFFKESEQNLKLQVKDRLWPVKLIRCTGKYSARFSGGWTAFAEEHRLEEGDVCIFELIDINNSVLEVHIFRC